MKALWPARSTMDQLQHMGFGRMAGNELVSAIGVRSLRVINQCCWRSMARKDWSAIRAFSQAWHSASERFHDYVFCQDSEEHTHRHLDVTYPTVLTMHWYGVPLPLGAPSFSPKAEEPWAQGNWIRCPWRWHWIWQQRCGMLPYRHQLPIKRTKAGPETMVYEPILRIVAAWNRPSLDCLQQ